MQLLNQGLFLTKRGRIETSPVLFVSGGKALKQWSGTVEQGVMYLRFRPPIAAGVGGSYWTTPDLQRQCTSLEFTQVHFLEP